MAHPDFAIEADDKPVAITALDSLPLLMPPAYNFVRRAVDTAFTRTRTNLKVVGEVEIVRTLTRAVSIGLGATIMPKAIADRIITEASEPLICRMVSPRIEETLSLCVSDHTPLSEPAAAVKDILIELTARLKLPRG